jgi:hypothetical protein
MIGLLNAEGAQRAPSRENGQVFAVFPGFAGRIVGSHDSCSPFNIVFEKPRLSVEILLRLFGFVKGFYAVKYAISY